MSEAVDINGERSVVFIDREIKQRRILEPYKAFTLLILALIKVYWLSSWIEQYCVNPIFNSPMEYHSFDLLLGIYCYSIQIYLNFSGYTDLVTGIALLLGFRLPINFNLPYLAKNVKKFWQRWHISLSTWIRDYIYFPLGGSRCSFTRTQCNVFIAMLLSGLWHGAGLNFIIWGIIHGLGMISLNIFNRFWGEDRISQFSPLIARLLTFHFICFTWIFFRSSTISEASDFLIALFSHFNGYPMQFNSLVIIIVLLMAFISYPYWAKLPHYFSRGLMRIHWALIPMILIPIIWLIVYFAPSGIPLFIYGGF